MKYLILDCETSHLFDYTKPADAPGQPRLCEIAMHFVTHDMTLERSIVSLIKPVGWTFDDAGEAAAVNGLTHARLDAEGVPATEIMREYGAAIDERRIIVSFGALYDTKVMRAELRHAGYPDRYMQTRYICLMQGCRKLVDARGASGRKKAPNLEEACKFFGLEPEPKPHQAIHGADRARQILIALHERGEMPAPTDPYEKHSKKGAA